MLARPALERLSGRIAAAAAEGLDGVVLHGPPGRFAAGADLEELQRLDARRAFEFARRGARLFRLLERSPLWLAAAVDGPCIGGALDLALACDLIVASPAARFRHPGTGLGFPTTYGGNLRLPGRLGSTAAGMALLRGAELSAAEAARLGLAAEVAAAGRILDRARERLCRWVAATPPAARRGFQGVLRLAGRRPLREAVLLERRALQAGAFVDSPGSLHYRERDAGGRG